MAVLPSDRHVGYWMTLVCVVCHVQGDFSDLAETRFFCDLCATLKTCKIPCHTHEVWLLWLLLGIHTSFKLANELSGLPRAELCA